MHRFLVFSLLLLTLLSSSCRVSAPKNFPSELLPQPASETPLLAVHLTDENAVVRMDFETYVAGVVAGEMPSSWPLEALKAQAILARTFVLKFISEKDSRYPGADISTDIKEAQAYNASAVNDRILQAVRETAGLILLTEDNALPYTWFHSHSGGKTETARQGIDWQGEEPAYTLTTSGMETDSAPWTAEFTAQEFISACQDTGVTVTSLNTVRIGQTSESGRTVTFVINGVSVNAARLRISLGSTKMRSTLLTNLSFDGETLRMSGLGYGHGVGLSQWGAHALAQRGWTAEEIALHYYSGLRIVRAW